MSNSMTSFLRGLPDLKLAEVTSAGAILFLLLLAYDSLWCGPLVKQGSK